MTFLSLINSYREEVDDRPTTQAALKHFRIEAGIKERASFKGGWKQPFLMPADFNIEDRFEELKLRIREHIPNYGEIEKTAKQELNKTGKCMIGDSDEDAVIKITGTDSNKTTKLKTDKTKLSSDEYKLESYYLYVMAVVSCLFSTVVISYIKTGRVVKCSSCRHVGPI